MSDPDTASLAAIAARLKALGEPNRLRILAALMDGDSCNCELQSALGLAPSLLSHHLRVLEKTGLVDSRRDALDGRWIYYAINRDTMAQWQQWLKVFLDPSRIATRPLCGPEGQLAACDGQ